MSLVSGMLKGISYKLIDFDYVAHSPDVTRTQDTLSFNLNSRSIQTLDPHLPLKPQTEPVGQPGRLTTDLDILDIGANFVRENQDILDVVPSSKSIA